MRLALEADVQKCSGFESIAPEETLAKVTLGTCKCDNMIMVHGRSQINGAS